MPKMTCMGSHLGRGDGRQDSTAWKTRTLIRNPQITPSQQPDRNGNGAKVFIRGHPSRRRTNQRESAWCVCCLKGIEVDVVRAGRVAA
jgi:hypothetical protein